MAKYLDEKRIRDILEVIVGTDSSGATRRCVGQADVEHVAFTLSRELGSLPKAEPIFVQVACTADGKPTLNCLDELAVADLAWFENVPRAIKCLMEGLDVDEYLVIRGNFHGFEEWNTHQLIKRVL